MFHSHPSGRFLVCSDRGLGPRCISYRRDASTQRCENDPGFEATRHGAGPRHSPLIKPRPGLVGVTGSLKFLRAAMAGFPERVRIKAFKVIRQR